MNLKHFFHQDSSTLTYVLNDEVSMDSVIIDPVLDYDPKSGTLSDQSLREVVEYISTYKLSVRGILETHAHADHITGAGILRGLFGAPIGISSQIKIVQKLFKDQFKLSYMSIDGRPFTTLFEDNGVYEFGTLKMRTIATPGHTPACMSYLFGNYLFCGDVMFIPDSGTGRCDFPGGSAKELYHSVHEKLFRLPDSTKVFVGHDYRPGSRELKYETTIAEAKEKNIHLKESTTENEYTIFREGRDKTLQPPKLFIPSIQINVNAGVIPPGDSLLLPLKTKFSI